MQAAPAASSPLPLLELLAAVLELVLVLELLDALVVVLELLLDAPPAPVLLLDAPPVPVLDVLVLLLPEDEMQPAVLPAVAHTPVPQSTGGP